MAQEYIPKDEEAEQLALCEYIRIQYPNVIFNSDLSGIRVGQGLANKIKKLRSENGIPDISIDEPRGNWFGLKLEMKATGNSPFRVNGMLKNDKHFQEQWRMLMRLELRGYCSGFAVGFDMAKEIVDWYMSLPKNY